MEDTGVITLSAVPSSWSILYTVGPAVAMVVTRARRMMLFMVMVAAVLPLVCLHLLHTVALGGPGCVWPAQ